MNTKIYNKVVSQFETRKGFGKASEAIWQTMPIAPTSISIRCASTTMLYRSKVSMYACEGEGVSTTTAEVRPRWKWSLERQRSVCSLTAYEGMHSSCEQLRLLFPSCRLAKSQNRHGLGCPYDNRKKNCGATEKGLQWAREWMPENLAFVVGRSLLPETLEVDLEEEVCQSFVTTPRKHRRSSHLAGHQARFTKTYYTLAIFWRQPKCRVGLANKENP